MNEFQEDGRMEGEWMGGWAGARLMEFGRYIGGTENGGWMGSGWSMDFRRAGSGFVLQQSIVTEAIKSFVPVGFI